MEPCQTGVAAGLVFGSSAIRRSILHFCKNNVFGMKSKAGIYFSPFQRSRKRKNVVFFLHSIFAFARFGRKINVCISILNKTAFFLREISQSSPSAPFNKHNKVLGIHAHEYFIGGPFGPLGLEKVADVKRGCKAFFVANVK